jgi:hypothetical protein
VSVISPGYVATQISVNSLTGSGEVHGSKYTAIVKLHKSGNTPPYCSVCVLLVNVLHILCVLHLHCTALTET